MLLSSKLVLGRCVYRLMENWSLQDAKMASLLL